MTTLAIIGTAGRREDSYKLTKQHWLNMCEEATKLVEKIKPDSLVSGGAAWADHLAVHLAKTLHIPTKIWFPKEKRDLDVAKYYHANFSRVVGYDTRGEMSAVYKDKGLTFDQIGTFKDRNTMVALEATVFLACTFGHGSRVKDGGTLDTVNKMVARGLNGYHLDLNSMILYPI